MEQALVPEDAERCGGGKKIHPTQKPVEILQYFIELLTAPGDTVLDTLQAVAAQARLLYLQEETAFSLSKIQRCLLRCPSSSVALTREILIRLTRRLSCCILLRQYTNEPKKHI
jgi:hypothetical protein